MYPCLAILCGRPWPCLEYWQTNTIITEAEYSESPKYLL